MATRYGMVDDLGFVSYEAPQRDFLGQRPGAVVALVLDQGAHLTPIDLQDLLAIAPRGGQVGERLDEAQRGVLLEAGFNTLDDVAEGDSTEIARTCGISSCSISP